MVKKVHDLGRTEKEMYGSSTAVGSKSKEKRYPNICVTTKEVPFLDEVEVGERMSLLAICEVKSIRKEKEGMEVTLDIKMLGEEGDMKMTKAVEDAIGPHTEIDESEEENETED